MIDQAKRWAVAQCWRLQRRARTSREELYRRATGMRILAFHQTRKDYLPKFKQIVDWCRGRYPMASPRDADALFEGSFTAGPTDKVLLTFDDGFESNYIAAEWLARLGISANFFVVPSLLDRSVDEYSEYHRRNGVSAFIMGRGERGLSRSQITEMVAMGHRIGAHNYAHRDLGALHSPEDLRYEITNSLEQVGEIVGGPCRDYAIAFGQPSNVSDAAIAYLSATCPNVYCCFRGLNVPGLTPRFALRHGCVERHPMSFTQLCVEGGGDHNLADRAQKLAARVGLLPGARRDSAA
jgi:hypothetical protein